MAQEKVDNASLASKVAIRRWLLNRMRLAPVSVLDPCTGLGHIWRAMGEHVEVDRWTRCDVKPRESGVLKMEAVDAVRVLPLADFNVIDVDTYGEPWAIWCELLPRLTRRTAVFLTRGHFGGMQHVPKAMLVAAGIPLEWEKHLPRSTEFATFIGQQLLGRAWQYATVEHAAVIRLQYVDYYALGLSPLSAKERARG